ncbi:MAG: hypothetical protein ACFE7R_07250, partial [Candidatus Hodarchaeota archaeon]
EIPLHPGDIREPEPEKKGGCSNPMMDIIVIIIIVAAGIIAVILMSDGIGPSPVIDSTTRDIANYANSDMSLSPSYYRGEFYVYSSECETPDNPELNFDISFDHTGDDAVTVSIHLAVYAADMATVDDAPTWGELDTYLVAEGDYTDSAFAFAELYGYAETYTWVIQFDASYKYSEWSVDIDIWLEYWFYE